MGAQRKVYVAVTKELFEQIKRIRADETPTSLMRITNLSQNSIYKLLRLFDENPFATFGDYSCKKGRKLKNREAEVAVIRDIFADDNSLTQIGVREEYMARVGYVSQSTIHRLIKSSGLIGKKIKKKPIKVLTEKREIR
ncbi:hypothetical protein SLOPH_539 [Spraguea lophii 42_110]|uniref:Transposase n=1 Tax=Spraguea lophii (strain 42_110) TaxID=1358809 RepID=S7XL99_SPRLO|nr:hypothetical protein SLOPH_539 [Spraguea lophii 42_110]